MRRRQSSEREQRLNLERNVKYRGTARIRLDHLHFEWGEARELSRKNVERLKQLFRTETIQRLEPRNHIPAVVHEHDLDGAVQGSKVSAETLLSNPDGDFPMLKFPRNFKLTCLHGRHRIQAARETLPPTDAWWTVDLYLTDTNPEVRATLVEEYSNQNKPSDGEIYRKIRQYEREGNICFKRRWKARLSTHGWRSLQQLFNHRDGELTTAFDNLLDVPGLWDGMRISTLHKMIGMKCDEEVLHYLEHIREVWHRLLRGDKAALQKVDQDTVKALELRAPRYSRRESLLLHGQMLSGQIFGAFSREKREEIWLDLRSIEGLIPSLFTFFEDLKYLSAPADCMKQLVHVSRGYTLFTAFQRKFAYSDVAEEQSVFEVAESTFSVKAGAMGDRFDLAYRQLWLFAMRHYKAIPTNVSKRGKDLLAKAGVEKADEAILSDFVALAQRLGFESKEIQALSQQSSDWQIARNALLKARKPDRYRYNEADLEDYVAQIVELFMKATPLPVEPLRPVLVSADPDAAGNRCGFPDEDAQEQDSRFLFLPFLHDEDNEVGQEITSFFVRRSVYQAFFGKISDVAWEDLPDYSLQGYSSSSQSIISTSELSQINNMEWTSQEESETKQSDLGETGRQQHEEEQHEQEQRLEQQRLELEQREKEQREKEQREKEQREKEQREKEQREKEQREKEQREKEQREKEEREKEQREKEEREKEQREKEQREKEQREKEQREKEQREKEEREKEQREKEQREKEEREKEQREKEQREKEQREKEEREKEQREKEQREQEQREKEQREKEQREKDVSRLDEGHDDTDPHTDMNDRSAEQQGLPGIERPAGQVIHITYRIRERGEWRIAHTLDMDPSDTSEVERLAVKYMRKRIRVFDSNLNILTPRNCFEAATTDGKNTVLLIPESDINIGREIEASVADLASDARLNDETVQKKRIRQ